MPDPKSTGLDESSAVRIPTTRAVVAEEVSRQLQALTPDDDDFDDDNEVTPVDRLTEMMRETGDGKARLKVYRQDPRTKVFEFCCEYMPEQFEEGGLDMLRRDWGPGSYQLKLYATHPNSNKFVIRATQAVTLAQMNSTAPVAIAAPSGDDRILTAILEGQNRLLEALTNRPQVDPAEQITKTLGLMTAMREAMGLNNQPQQKTPVAEIVEAIKELKNASELISGKEEKEDSTDKMLSLGGEVIGLIKNGLGGQPAQTAQPFPQLSVPASLTAPAENPIQPAIDPEDDEMLEQLLFVNKLKKQFIPLAGDDTKIEEAALFLDEKTPESLDGLLAMMEQPTWFELLQTAAPQYLPALVPVVTTHREWLTKVRDRLLELLKEED